MGPAPGAPIVLMLGTAVVRRRVDEEPGRRGELELGVWGMEAGLGRRAVEDGRGNFDIAA